MVMYLQEVMLVSLGATVDNISDQRIYYLVNDKKISLLCYQFFKKFTFECKCSSVFFLFLLKYPSYFWVPSSEVQSGPYQTSKMGRFAKIASSYMFHRFWIHLCSYRSRCLHVFYRKPGDKHFTEKN